MSDKNIKIPNLPKISRDLGKIIQESSKHLKIPDFSAINFEPPPFVDQKAILLEELNDSLNNQNKTLSAQNEHLNKIFSEIATEFKKNTDNDRSEKKKFYTTLIISIIALISSIILPILLSL